MRLRHWLLWLSVLALLVSAILLAQAPQPPGTPIVIAPGIWTLTPSSTSVIVGGTVQITSSSGTGTTWITNNPAIATVNANGVVTGVSVGTTTILARKDNKNGQSIISVFAGPPPVDCVVSAWSAFSACTNGLQTRTRTVITPAANGGAACGPLSETQSCVVPPPTCPPDCPPPPSGAINVQLSTKEALYPGSMAGLARTDEPVTVSVPFPDDSVNGVPNVSGLALTGASIGQFRTLSTWASGRVQWALIDTQLSALTAGGTSTALSVIQGSGNFGGGPLATDNGSTITVATGAATFTIKKANFNGFDTVVVGSTTVVATGTSDGFVVIGPAAAGSYPANVTCTPTSGGATCNVAFKSSNDAGSTCSIEENGPARAALVCTYDLEDASGNVYMHGTARLHFYLGKTYAKVVSVLRNADDGTTGTKATAYKGHRGYELRTSLNISTAANTATVANHTGTPTTIALSGSDTAYLFQGISTQMQFEDNPIAYQISDSGYVIAKNGSNVQTGTSAQRNEGWCEVRNAAGVGMEVGTYQFSGSYPKGCNLTAGGTVMAIGILPAQSTTPYYMEWPQWDEYTTNFVNFHTAAPASPANDFLKFQHALVARVTDFAYYNTAGVLPTPVLDPLIEDTYTTNVGATANPSISGSSLWATNNATRAQDFGTTDTTFALTIIRSFSWNLESEYRYGYMLNYLTRGMTGRLLQARHFYEHHLAYMLPHSDGFNWRSGHLSVINGFGLPTGVTSGNSTLGTHGANEHNWRDQEHAFWYGMMLYYALSGDEFMREAMIDQQKDWFLTPDTYQQGGGAGVSEVTTVGTAVTKVFGTSWTNTLVGQVMLIGDDKTGYEVASVADATHLTLTTSAGTRASPTGFIIFNGLFNARSIATQLSGAARFSEFLRGIGDAESTAVLTGAQHLFDEQVKAKGCMNGYPANCLIGGTNNEDVSGFKSQGVNRERGAHWGSAGNSGNYCGVAHTYRVNSIFQEALISEAMLEFAAYRGTSWGDYYLARDLAYGISQWALNEGWYGGTSSQAVDGFRGGMAFDTRNDCMETTDLWNVTITGTAVTRNSGPNFVTNGNWTSAYAIMYDGTSAFVCGGIPRLIASVESVNALTLQSATGNGTMTCYWREENYDEAYSNGALTSWPHYFARSIVTGDRTWETKFRLSMQRSMAINGLSFRDLLGHLISRTIKYLTDGASPVLNSITLTNFVENGGGSYTLTWAPLTGGAYRLKWSPKLIVDLIGFNSDTNSWTGDPATQQNWSGATNILTTPTCTTTCTATVSVGTTGLVAGNFSVKGAGGVVPTTFTSVTWTNQTHTTGWPGYNGFLEWAGFDTVSGTAIHYGIPSTSSSIYSTNVYSYNVLTNFWTLIGGNNHTGNNCIDSWPSFPPDRHPVGQMAVDTLRNRLWLVGGVCSGIDRTDMAYMSLNANPATDAFTRVTLTTVPTALNSGSLVYDSQTDALLLFGPNSGSILQVWIYCPSATLSTAQQLAGCVTPQTWAQLTFTGGPFLGDAFARIVYSTVQQQTVIFGGLDNSTPTNELWTYTTATKTFTRRCLAPCSPPPVYNGPASPPTFAFVEIPSANTFFFHQTFNTGAPRDWTFTFGANATADAWAVVPSTGSGPSADSVATYDPVRGVVLLWTRNPGAGTADVWQGQIAPFTSACTTTTANLAQATVQAAITAAVPGAVICLPAGSATWASQVQLNKSLTLRGAGIDATVITAHGFDVAAGVDDYRITGFTFDGNWGTNYLIAHGQSRTGNKRFRIDHNKFLRKDYTTSGTVLFHGFSYGVIDHNVFQDVLDEIISVGGDGAPSELRTPIVGGYENGTIFIEDNQFTLTAACSAHFGGDPNGAAENVFDANSGPRVVFRYNTVTDHATCRWQYPIEMHGFESEFSTVGDARPIYGVEIYNNTFTANHSGSGMAIRVRGLGGGGVVFNNTFTGSGHAFDLLAELRNLRSHATDDTGSLSKGNLNAAGYTELAHTRQSDEGGLTCEHCSGHPGLVFGQVRNLFLWNNTNAGSVSVQSSGFTTTDIVLNTHFFLSAMPGYTPYTYPHPLVQ